MSLYLTAKPLDSQSPGCLRVGHTLYVFVAVPINIQPHPFSSELCFCYILFVTATVLFIFEDAHLVSVTYVQCIYNVCQD